MSELITAEKFNLGSRCIHNQLGTSGSGLGFFNHKQAAGNVLCIESKNEQAILLLSGEIKIICANQVYQYYRGSYFREDPVVFNYPKNTQLIIESLTDSEFFQIETANKKLFEPKLFDSSNILESEQRGEGILNDVSHRIVRTVFDKRNHMKSNLVLGEIISFSGHWSSCPPHEHPQPEIYHYRFSEPKGFAFGEMGESVQRIHHGDTMLLTDSDCHAHATAPGYAMYTLWFIRHLENAPYIVPDFQPDHAWSKSSTANQRVFSLL